VLLLLSHFLYCIKHESDAIGTSIRQVQPIIFFLFLDKMPLTIDHIKRLICSINTLWLMFYLSGCSPQIPDEEPVKTFESVKIERVPASTTIPHPPTTPTATPNPGLSEEWADLPELTSVEDFSIPQNTHISIPTPGQKTSYPVTNSVFPNLEIKDSIWTGGQLNGSPSGKENEAISGEEYDISERMDSVIHITGSELIPPYLQPQQRMVIHLSGLEPGFYRVNVATTGGEAGTIKEEYLDIDKLAHRNLTIRWNDHLLWQRWLPPVFFITRVAVPPSKLTPNSNLLLLENSGTQPLPLDMVWVDRVPQTGDPFYVSMEDAQWFNRSDSKWVRNTTITLSLPEIDTTWLPPKDFSATSAAQTPSELLEKWQEVLVRYKDLQNQAPNIAEAFHPWMQKTYQAVMRGMVPSVAIKSSPNSDQEVSLKLAAYLFNGIYHTWILPSSLTESDYTSEIKKRSPNTRIFSAGSNQSSEIDSQITARYPQPFNALLNEHAAKYRRFFDGEQNQASLEKSLKESLVLRALFRGYNWSKQSYHSDEFFSAAGDVLMVNDQPLIVHGGFPGSPFFPAGDDTPGLMWHYLKPLFRFGGPDFHKGIANLTSDSSVMKGIGRTSWAVASNGSDSVHVLVRNHIGLNDSRVKLEVPVPWTGPSRVMHHSVRSSWSIPSNPPQPNLDRRNPEATGKDNTGWIEMTFNLEGIQLFEISPEGSQFSRQIEAPERIGFSELEEVKNLFHVSRHAPPPWWSRMPMGAHFFAYWRYSGNVSLNVDVAATRDKAPDWAPFQSVHIAVPEEVKAVSPLRDTSTRFRFDEPIEGVAQVLRAGYNRSSTYKGEVMGIWLRVHPPPGFKRKFDPFHAIPHTQFYMGKMPYRQLIDVEYGRWYFISSKADLWRTSISRYSPYLVFWPANPEDGNPEIEINSFEMYQVKLEDNDITPSQCMGFIQEDSDGNPQILILGIPGKPAYWRQRLPNLIEVNRLTHAVDRQLLTTAETPEEDPPELVRHRVTLMEDSKILEIEIEKMPASPSPEHLRKIEQTFPLLRNVVTKRNLGVFLMEMEDLEP
jgi:hypothetical protein